MSDSPNEITIDNSVLVLIDHQPWVAFSVKSIDAGLLVNNLAGIAASARALDVPIILTTVGAEGGGLKDPLINGITEVLPDVTPIDRVSTNAWEDIRPAVEATGRRTLLIAGLWTEVCLAQTAVSAIAEGYRVFFISDCSGGMSDEAHEDAKARLELLRRDGPTAAAFTFRAPFPAPGGSRSSQPVADDWFCPT